MAKLLKIVAKIIGGTFEWLLILVIVAAFAVRTSTVQTWLAQMATSYLSAELNTEMHIGKVDIFFFDRVALDDVFVRDQSGDTLASLGSIKVVLSSLDIANNKFTLSNIALENGRVGISRDSLEGAYNYWFITDYFDSGKKTRKKKNPTDLTVKSLTIEHVDITYDDYRKSYSDYGMDYDHLAFKDVILHADAFKNKGKSYSFNLERFSTTEKSGLKLKRLKAQCRINEKGIFLSNLKINTSRSRIYASKFNLRMDGLTAIRSFVDSVTFQGIIDSSRVNLIDVSYFAPALKGMYQEVSLSATLTHKVKDLKISDFDLRTGKRTILRGTIQLPDFRSLESSFLKENLQYAFVDLEDLKALRLPDRVEEKFISLNPMVSRLGYFEVKNLDLVGYWSQFVLSSKQISTGLGTVKLDNGLLFTAIPQAGGYEFERSANSNYDVYVDSFNLGRFIDDPMFGKVNGKLFLGGVVGQKDVIRLTKLEGELNSVGFNNYNYTNIAVQNGSYINNRFDATVEINDPHLQLVFDGFIDLNKGQTFDFVTTIPKADLGRLHFTKSENTSLVANLEVKMKGSDLSNYSGSIVLHEFTYTEDSNSISIPDLSMTLDRGSAKDYVQIRSAVADVNIEGKINPATIATSFNNLLSGPLSAYFQYKPFPKKTFDSNVFDLDMTVKNEDEVLAIFVPGLDLSYGTKLKAHYDAADRLTTLNVTEASQITYDSIVVRDLNVVHSFTEGYSKTEVNAGYFALNDSLYVRAVDIDVNGTDNVFKTTALWNQGMQDPADFRFTTTLAEGSRVKILLRPSYFSIKNQLWEIMNTSELNYAENRMEIDHLVLEHEEQFVAINGVLSDRQEDVVTVNINNVHLNEISSFINTNMTMEGFVNGDVRISTPFTAFRADGDLTVKDLVINEEPIGDVVVNALWDNEKERMVVNGDLKYLGNDTFEFTGDYYPYKETDNIDVDLDFNGMDLQFANAFIDPTVVRDIRGKVKGNISITGRIEAPKIDGKLKLDNGNVKIDFLGVNFKLNGPIKFDGRNSLFTIDNMPVTDEEGHTASLSASISHTDFAQWSCDVGIDMEYDYSHSNGWGGTQRIDKFLVLNTRYKEGEIFYGKAYVTGTANIFVTEDDVNIDVNARTEKGTWIDLPMYGNAEISEVDFIDYGEKVKEDVKKDLSGLNLNLNFDVTEDATVKLIFNDKTGDEIVASGNGDLHIRLDELNDVYMTGKYILAKNSRYNFVMGPVKQTFNIREGSRIDWTGSAYNANLDIKAYQVVRASLNEITQDVIEGGPAASATQDIECVMHITETLNAPLISLDIQAPNASQSGKAILARIRSDKDELQKQFFSLLLFKKFVPLNGQGTGGTGGIADVVTNQLNTILDGMSDRLKVRLDYDEEELTNEQQLTVGLKTQLNDRIIISSNFGVSGADNADGQTQTSLVGDMRLEYLINDDGSFRVNIFNESNETSVIQDKSNGLFTQGVGLHYQEDFNTLKDFKVMQAVLDLFRKEDKKRVKIKKRRVQVSIDTDPTKPPPGDLDGDGENDVNEGTGMPDPNAPVPERPSTEPATEPMPPKNPEDEEETQN